MLIIIEGCDGTGKTTLANMLKPLLGAEIVHCTTQTPNTYDFFDAIIHASLERNIIVDRFCYSQFAYQGEEDRPLNMHKVYPIDEHERYVEDSYEALQRLEVAMLHADVKLIYCTTTVNNICERIYDRGEKPIPVEDILNKYEDLWKRTLIQPIRYAT